MSSDDDYLTSLISGNTPSTDQVKAIVDQLRRRGTVAELGMMSGDSGLGEFGKQLATQNDIGARTLGAFAQKNRTEQLAQDQFANVSRHQGITENIEQGKLDEDVRWHNQLDQERRDLAQQKLDAKAAASTPQAQHLIQGIIDGNLPPLTSRSDKSQTIMDEVMARAPDYDATKYVEKQKAQVAFGSGKQGDLMRSADVAINHLDQADALGDKLGGSKYPALNWLSNAWKTQTGSPDVQAFNTAKQIVAAEVNKFIVGANMTEDDRKSLQGQLSAASSPEQLKAVTGTLRGLMGGQLQGLQGQFTRNGLGDSDTFLKQFNPRTRDALSLGHPKDYDPAAPGAAAPPAVPSPQGPLSNTVKLLSGGDDAITTAPDGSPITPYSKDGLLTALRGARAAPSTLPGGPSPAQQQAASQGLKPTIPVQSMPKAMQQTIVKKGTDKNGRRVALLSDGTVVPLDN